MLTNRRRSALFIPHSAILHFTHSLGLYVEGYQVCSAWGGGKAPFLDPTPKFLLQQYLN